MCDPATLTVAATLTAVAGAGYQGYTAYTEANYKASVAQNNATLSREQARDAELRGQEEEQLKWRQIAQTRAAQIAAMAASGIDTSFGSAADVVGDTMVLGTEDARVIRDNAARETRGFQIQAQNYDEERRGQKRAGRQALVATAFNITSTILGGAQQLQGMKLPTPATKVDVPGFTSGAGSQWAAPYIRTR